MNVRIRYSIAGKPSQRLFRIVAIDSRRKRESGKWLDYIGFYNPHSKEAKVDEKKVKNWLSKGAQTSKTVRELFKRKKIL